MAAFDFDIKSTDKFGSAYSTLPAGEYMVEIVDEELFKTSAGHKCLAFDYQIINGEYKGQRVRDYMNLWNPNPKAVEIARKRVASIAHATGQVDARDSRFFHRKPFVVKVGVEIQGGVKRNTINDYFAVNRNAEPAPAPDRFQIQTQDQPLPPAQPRAYQPQEPVVQQTSNGGAYW